MFLFTGMRGNDSLIKLMDEFLEKLAKSSWESLDSNQIWNVKRPVWLQALIQLVEPHLIPCIESLLVKLDSSQKLNKEDIKANISNILQDVTEIVDLIPVPLLKLCIYIESKMPSDIKPLNGSVLLHIIICGLYGIISNLQYPLSKNRASREKIDYTLALGEALLNISHEKEVLNEIQQIASQILEMEKSRYFPHNLMVLALN